MVSEAIDGGAAAKAGVAAGDILLKFAGRQLTGVDDLHRLLTYERAGQPAILSILRGPEIQALTIIPQPDA